jgi:hypothetical protein
MKKHKKTANKAKRSRTARGSSNARARRRVVSKPRPKKKAVAIKRRRPAPKTAVRAPKKSAPKPATQIHSRSVAKLAASVLSRRAARVEAQAAIPAPATPPVKTSGSGRAPGRSKATGTSKHPRQGSSRPGRPLGAAALPGNRPLVKAARVPQFNYMKAPGADHGFDVGDSVEVFCDHEEDGERIRGWIKGVVVQVDNKLVAVQFRSNVFLTDGWMVPDRILWYSLGSDQIRNTSLAKRTAHAVIPEY